MYLIQFAIFEVDRHRFKQLLKRKKFQICFKNRFITCLSYSVNGVCKKIKSDSERASDISRVIRLLNLLSVLNRTLGIILIIINFIVIIFTQSGIIEKNFLSPVGAIGRIILIIFIITLRITVVV